MSRDGIRARCCRHRSAGRSDGKRRIFTFYWCGRSLSERTSECRFSGSWAMVIPADAMKAVLINLLSSSRHFAQDWFVKNSTMAVCSDDLFVHHCSTRGWCYEALAVGTPLSLSIIQHSRNHPDRMAISGFRTIAATCGCDEDRKVDMLLSVNQEQAMFCEMADLQVLQTSTHLRINIIRLMN